jgi:hypothetical protein
MNSDWQMMTMMWDLGFGSGEHWMMIPIWRHAVFFCCMNEPPTSVSVAQASQQLVSISLLRVFSLLVFRVRPKAFLIWKNNLSEF